MIEGITLAQSPYRRSLRRLRHLKLHNTTLERTHCSFGICVHWVRKARKIVIVILKFARPVYKHSVAVIHKPATCSRPNFTGEGKN